MTLSDSSHTIGQMRHTLTASMPIAGLTFKDILRALVTSAVGNREAFWPKPQTTPKTPIQPFQVVLVRLSCLWGLL